MIKIVTDTIIIYFVLTVTVRLMGKRELGELQLSEVISSLLLSEIAATSITNPEIPIIKPLVAIGIILIFEVTIPILMSRFSFLKSIFEGKPSYIIYKGKLSQKELKKNRITIDELLASLHSNGYSDISELDYVILEPNGQLSAFPKAPYKNPSVSDLKLTVQNSGIAHTLIIDGKISYKTIENMNMSEEDVLNLLSQYNGELKNTFLLTVDDLGNTNYIEKLSKN